MGIKHYIDKKRYKNLPDKQLFIVRGWCFDSEGEEVTFVARVNQKKRVFKLKTSNRSDVKKKFEKKYKPDLKCGFHITVELPKDIEPTEFELIARTEVEAKTILKLNERGLNKLEDKKSITYAIDFVSVNEDVAKIRGWAVSYETNDPLNLAIVDQSKKKQDIRLARQSRKDLVKLGIIEEAQVECGFEIDVNYIHGESVILILSDGVEHTKVSFDPDKIDKKNQYLTKVGMVKTVVKKVNAANVKKGIVQLQNHGFKGFKEYLINRINHGGKPYELWFEENKATKDELEKQAKKEFEYAPLISVVTPTYKTPQSFLRKMIDSVINQSYSNWELCIADGSGGDAVVEAELKAYAEKDSRIKYKILEENLGIADNTNEAITLATGEYIGLFDHDDELAPNALYEVVKALQKEKYDILYTDEDKIRGEKEIHEDPNFKPDFSPDLFTSHNYITHFFVVKHEIVKEIGGFRKEFDGSQDYDLMFRCIEKAKSIKHIPKILYHWRIHENSVAGDPSSKMYAYTAGQKSIEEHLKRVGVDAEVEMMDLWGMYHVKYKIKGDPLVSVIIPNKDHREDLKRCLDSIFAKSVYKNLEIIIVENNSEEKETFAYYKELEEKHKEVKVVTWKEGFNYSAINNFGVEHSSGEYLLFLNNDTELISPEGISELLGCCMREDVGAVGAKLLYEDETVQHAGVVIGFGGYAGHVNTEIGRNDYGYMVRARINGNYSAVTAACLMTKRAIFEEIGGFDPIFEVAGNDVDLCLRIRELDKYIVFNAFSEWFHYESKSRGYENTLEKMKRFDEEVNKFRERWDKILKDGDPFYNKNFAIHQAPYTLP
ncbi:glycosyltransferase involved in cell wall biosynthesis [Aequitasia blattaphilus]|uniref:Glycosyltransferase family 2 protein n=1 Tax=Aequitasia blattaphilus TaxID=2949332 RepID=A0ABT1E916_9FIRM|nr:glycosyltransferase family 2 protein [Aequitasia blattaphilus]MCP1101361.1 glycosyltransferase family 2 protein [Aequitasia blattaphilus]MCR8614001.1 glycosyltransferase family 2 protein [Aequitasia blattaphilus]